MSWPRSPAARARHHEAGKGAEGASVEVAARSPCTTTSTVMACRLEGPGAAAPPALHQVGNAWVLTKASAAHWLGDQSNDQPTSTAPPGPPRKDPSPTRSAS